MSGRVRLPLAAAAALAADRRGTSVIEFALFVPLLALAVLGISDIAMGHSRKTTIEQAVARALEKVAVGTVAADYSALRTEVATAAQVAPGDVAVDQWLECDRVRQASFTGTCGSGEEIARYISLRVAASYTPAFRYGPLARGFANPDGTVPITAFKALRLQ